MQLTKYFREVRDELKRVTWPKKEQTVKMTTIVIVASLMVGLYIGGLDFLFTNLLGFFFK